MADTPPLETDFAGILKRIVLAWDAGYDDELPEAFHEARKAVGFKLSKRSIRRGLDARAWTLAQIWDESGKQRAGVPFEYDQNDVVMVYYDELYDLMRRAALPHATEETR